MTTTTQRNKLDEDTVVLVTSNGREKADKKLEPRLIGKHLEFLLQGRNLPSAICFCTDGVQLVCYGSPVIEQLKKPEARNVRLIICSTCLDYFELTKKVQLGIVGGMALSLKPSSKQIM